MTDRRKKKLVLCNMCLAAVSVCMQGEGWWARPDSFLGGERGGGEDLGGRP